MTGSIQSPPDEISKAGLRTQAERAEQFTPGPWTANIHHRTKSGASDYAYITATAVVPVAGVFLSVEGYDDGSGTANARLIAAAPDLYEALKAMVEHCQHLRGVPVFENADAALAKASPTPNPGDGK